jgi:hypothetical protein
MKKILLITGILLLGAACFAQTEPVAADNEAYETRQAAIDLDIQIKAMIPDISVVQIKTDTYAKPGNYKFTIDLGMIQKESKIQLTNWQNEITKWLEESK